MFQILLGKYHAFPLNFQSHEDKHVLLFSTKDVPSHSTKKNLKRAIYVFTDENQHVKFSPEVYK